MLRVFSLVLIGCDILLFGVGSFVADTWVLRPNRMYREVQVSWNLKQERQRIFDLADPKKHWVLGDSIVRENRGDSLGDSGFDFLGVRGEFALNLMRWVPLAERSQSDTLFVAFGINDIFAGIALERMSDTLSTFIHTMSEGGKHIVLLPTLPPECPWFAHVQPPLLRYRARLWNKRQAELATDHANASFLCLGDFLGRLTNGTYFRDGIHLNAAGREAWRQAIIACESWQ